VLSLQFRVLDMALNEETADERTERMRPEYRKWAEHQRWD